MTLFETLFASFIGLIISSLSWLAYKHHHAYLKLFTPLNILLQFIVWTVMAYDFGFNNGAMNKTTNSGISIPITMLIMGAGVAFLIFLYFLPALLSKDGKYKEPE